MSVANEVVKFFSNKTSKCYDCKYGELCPVQVDNEGHYYPMFGEPIGDCQTEKGEKLALYNQGKKLLDEIAAKENRAITIDDINRVCDKLGIN
jgi:hypothetical protein